MCIFTIHKEKAMNPVSQRLLSQQLIVPQFKDPAQVVSWFGAMQAQDYRAMRWAVAMRTQKPSSAAFGKAFNEGRIIRTHLQRTTWQLVAGEDYPWMLELCRPRALAGLRGWMHANGIDIPDKERLQVQELLARTASGKRSLLKEDFARALEEKGVCMTDQRLSYHLRLAEYDGLLCSGDLHPTKRTLALVSERIGYRPAVERDEALTMLARKYFRSHGPATLEDFVWWSGLGMGDCRRGMSALGGELVGVQLDGKAYFCHRDARTRGFRSGGVLLIPAFDEYLIGYKSRHVVLPPDLAHRAHNQSGIFYHVVALDGKIVGNWRPLEPGCGISVFKEGVLLPEEALSREIRRYASCRL